MTQKDYFQQNYELHKQIVQLEDTKLSVWLDNVLFTYQWWIGIALTIVPWILWFIFSKKESRNRLLYTGFLIIIFSSFLDFIGVKLGLWLYNYAVFPWVPPYAPWDLTLMPVVVMGLIEFKPNLSPIVKGLIFSFLTSFVGEYIFETLHLYEPLNWRYIYSFPIYFVIYLIGHWASLRDNYAPYKAEHH